MNLQHLKYAVTVAEFHSINKAADALYISQPNLSRAIRELEQEIGITIFKRTPQGVSLTFSGEEFLFHARAILTEVEQIQRISEGGTTIQRFSLCAPRAGYISGAFTRFLAQLDSTRRMLVDYKETNSMRAIRNIQQEDYRLGIIRYAQNYDGYYRVMMEEKGLEYRTITEFRYSLLLNEKSPLAQKEKISREDLRDCMEIAYADPYVPFLPFAEVKKEELPDNSGRRIFIFERASQLELLSRNTDAYMWVSPLPEELLRRYGLIQVPCDANRRIYKDVLIYRKNYVFSELDQIFLEELEKAKQTIFH